MVPGLDQVQIGIRCATIGCNTPPTPVVPCSLETQFRGERRLDGCDLRARVDQEIVGTRVVDLDGNNNKCALHEAQG